MSAETMVLPP